jgi:hypothetical protein
MAHTYYASNTASDLTGGGNFDFTFAHDPDTANTANVWTIAKQSTEAFDIFTEANDTSDQGDATGSWTYELNIITGSADALGNVYIYRVNSGGTIQAGPIECPETDANTYAMTAGVKSFTWSSPALGTFQSGDRVRVRVSATVPGHQNVDLTLGWNTTDSEFIAPYTLAGAQPYAQCVWA